MAYPALTDRRMPYDNDGTRVGYGEKGNDSAASRFAQGLTTYFIANDLIELNDQDFVATSVDAAFEGDSGNARRYMALWWFFPERRQVTAAFFGFADTMVAVGYGIASGGVQGSADSTNGVDGTWETASVPSGIPGGPAGLDTWRMSIRTISFTGGKNVLRVCLDSDNPAKVNTRLRLAHLYGEKAAGQTPDDLIFIDHDTTPGAEYATPEDFGDRPLATTLTRQFRVKNASATKTANTINLQCNDADFAISTDGTTWVATINITSLAAGAESATMYIRNTTPAIGSLLGPRFSRIVMTAASWT